MLMDFQMEGGQAVAAELVAEMQDIPQQCRTPTHEIRTFGLPRSVWSGMFASYAIFFAALIVATGRDTATIFALVISMAYTVMYFGTAAILNGVSSSERKAVQLSEQLGGIETHTGWLDSTAAYAQILMVPMLLAVFACAFAVIRALVG